MKIYLKYAVYFILALPISAGCVEESLETDGGSEIILSAGLQGSVLSKAPAEGIYPDTDASYPVSLLRWDQDDNLSWSDRKFLPGDLGAPEASSDGLRRPIDFDKPQYCKSRDLPAGFIGIYPEAGTGGGWEQSDGKYITSDDKMTYVIDGRTDVMVSDFMSGTQASGIDPLQFRHALCMFNFYVYAVDDASRDQWGKLQDVSIVNLPKHLTVTLPETVSGSSPVFSFGKPYMTEVETGLSLSYFSDDDLLGNNDMELPVGLSSDLQDRYVGTLLGGTPKDGILGLSVKTSLAEDLNSVSIARDFKPGYTYNVVLRFSSSGIINADVTVEEWQPYGDLYYESETHFYSDLSRYGTSNSYVVSSANMSYCFDATVKGNGVYQIESDRLGVIPLLGEAPDIDPALVAKVEILRSDAVMKREPDGSMSLITDFSERSTTKIIELDSDKLRDGKVLFSVPGSDEKDDYSLPYEGNVKIGIKDAAGNVLWSWHIWVTDPPMNQNYLNGHIAMDRNLGAVISSVDEWKSGVSWPEGKMFAEYAWGLYYQFGRKDPMFIPAIYNEEGGYVKDHAVTDISEAHENPWVFYYDGTGGSGNWISGVDTDHLWGYVSRRDNYVKTMYDPCPPGYRVTGMEIWQQNSDEYTLKPSDQLSDEAGTVVGMGQNGSVYYPVSHMIYKGNEAENDDDDTRPYTYLLSATPVDGTDQAYHFRYNREAEVDAINQGGTFPIIVPEETGDTGYKTGRDVAYPVRCVLEASGPIVTDLSEAQTANSYLISKTGFYKFKANVRGNGVTSLTVYTDAGVATLPFDDGMTASLSPSRVDLLWWQGDLKQGSPYMDYVDGLGDTDPEGVESVCPVYLLDNGSVDSDGYVYMYVRVSEAYGSGNVGLAAYDEYNHILWSWHIWIQPGVENVQVGDYSLMDRNLGATMAPASMSDVNKGNVSSTYGLYYQWGRKDPFFPPGSESDNTASSPWLYKDPRSGWSVREQFGPPDKRTLTGPVLISESVSDPLSYVAVDQNDWQDSYEEARGVRRNLWGFTGNAVEQGNSFAKTMYDTCPPGYKVMPHNVVETANFCRSEDETKNYIDNPEAGENGILLSPGGTTDLGEIIIDDAVWLPFSGRLDSHGDFSEIGEKTGYWSTATPYTTSGQEKSSREIKWGYDWSYYIHQRHSNNKMSEGRPVRCMKE